MRHPIPELLRDPTTGDPLEVVAFEAESGPDGDRVLEGLVYSRLSGKAYPILRGVPVMIEGSFPPGFLQKHADSIAAIDTPCPLQLSSDGHEHWSFSVQWDHHYGEDVERTWGYSDVERVRLFLMESQIDESWCEGKRILDAGCGTGRLADDIAQLGAEVVGLDFSSGVQHAELQRQSLTAHFIQGDLLAPPLPPESFDAVLSIGVLHHTRNTREAFERVAELVKPGGRFYVWLYRRPEGFLRRYVKTPIFQSARAVISRMPPSIQQVVVKTYARMVRSLHTLKHDTVRVPPEEYVVAAYDDLTCRWRHYHTVYEVSRWFFECGFSPATLSHWDNPYGFGMVALKDEQAVTPGINYGVGAKLWDERQTLVG